MKPHRRKIVPRPLCEPLDPRRLLTADPHWGTIYADQYYPLAPGSSVHIYTPNSGSGSTIRLYLSTDAIAGNSDDVLVSSYPDYWGGNNFTLPTTLRAPATYHIVATADNQFPVVGGTIDLIAPSAGRDLAPLLVGRGATDPILPDHLIAGQTVTPTGDISNLGQTPSGAFSVALYLSPTPTLSPAATLLTTQSPYLLDPLSTVAADFGPITIPRTLTPGTYYPIISIDPANQVAETNESNNLRVGHAITVSAPSLDLSLLSATYDLSDYSDPTSGRFVSVSTYPLTATVRNSSNTPGTFTFRLSITTDGTSNPLSNTDVANGTESLFIPAHTTLTFNTQLKTQSVLVPAGDQHFMLNIDSDPDVTPGDNSLLGPTYSARPDFVVEVGSDSTPYTAGLSRELSVDVWNFGNALPQLYHPTVAFYLSADNVLTLADPPLSTIVLDIDSTHASTQFTVPATLPPGTYYPFAVVDPSNQIDEVAKFNNGNNGVPITVLPPGDMTPTSVTFPAITHPDQLITPYLTVSVTGIPNNQPFSARYVLTTDSVVGNDDDVPIGSAGYYDSLPYSTTPATRTFGYPPIEIPDTTPVGTYHIGVILDPDNSIPEADESNNTLLGPTITVVPSDPDLAISAPPTLTLSTSRVNYRDLPYADISVASLWDVNPQYGFTVSLYLSSDPTLSPDDVLVGSTHQGAYFGPTDPPTAVQINGLNIPHTLGATWYPIAVVQPNDSNGISPDADPSNNVSVGQPFTTAATHTLTIDSVDAFEFDSILSPDFYSVHGSLSVLTTGYFPSDTFTVRYYLTTDNTIDDADLSLGTQTYSITSGLSPDPVRSSFFYNFDILAPISGQGAYHLAVVLDGSDAPPTFATQSISIAYPDPAVTAGPTFTPTSPGGPFTAGDTVTASFPLTNDADGFSLSVPYKIYLSTDNTLGANAILVYATSTSYPVPNDGIGAHSSQTRTASFKLPFSTTTTTYYPIVVIEPAQVDLDSSNNSAVGSPIVVNGSYLLSLTVPAFTGPTLPGTSASLSFTVTNNGSKPSPPTPVDLSLTQDRYHSLTPLDPITIDPLAPGASRTVTVTRQLPTLSDWADFQDREFTLTATTTGPVFFPDSSHQASTSLYLNGILIEPPSDLSLFSLSSPAAVTRGSALRLFTTPSSNPNTFSDPVPFDVAYFLSIDDTLGDADDVPLGTTHFDGTSSSQSQSALTVPSDLPPGTYRLIALVDPDNAVDESDETNNTFVANTVTIVAPTLSGSLSAAAASLPVGTTARFNLSLSNLSSKPAHRKYAVAFYLSDDPTFSSGDALFSRQTIDAVLTPAKPKAFPLTAKVPANAALGTRYVIAVVDAAAGPKSPASHLEVVSQPVTLLGPHLTASVFAVRPTNRSDTSKVTVRVLNDGTSAFAGPITLRVLCDVPDPDTVVVMARKSAVVKVGKYVDYTFTVRRSALAHFSVALA